MSHLNLDLVSPVWSHWLSLLARRNTLIRYDLRGSGMSARENVQFSLDRFVEDFEAVTDAAGLDRFAVFGIAGGASIAIAYAICHPTRVSHLVVHGCDAKGPLAPGLPTDYREQAEMQLKAIGMGWSNDNPAFRQLFTSLLIPDGTAEHFRSFNEQIRRALPPANAKAIIETIWKLDTGYMAAKLRCPTLVFHSLNDGRIPFEYGKALAELIPNARFIPLESRNHLLLEHEPAWHHFVAEIEDFLPSGSAAHETDLTIKELTPREREVLEMVAQGLDNHEIAARLGINEKTVRNHATIIFSKLKVTSRAQAVARARDNGLGRVAQR
jgi:DNA-binding NarL/FixJ family response regulator